MKKIVALLNKKRKMKYLNQFHKESEERKLVKLAMQQPTPAEEASRRAFEMHKKLAEDYPNQSNKD